MKKIKVCVVDDNRELVEFIRGLYFIPKRIWKWSGIAHNGQDCLEMLENIDPDVLVLDIIMPHLDGLAVLEQLREMNKASFTKCYYA